MLEIDNIKKSYGDLPVLDILSWKVAKGESVALLGANATGKSTLLELIAGLITDYEGTVKLDSRILRGPTRRIGIVLQNPVMFSTSVARNVGFGLDGMTRRERSGKVADALRMVGLEGLQRRNARTLSEGQKQRVAIARTLALEPEILLLDEPSASVDRQSARKIAAILTDLNRRRNVTIIVATHDLELARMVAVRTDILTHGRPVPYIAGNVYSGRAVVKDGEMQVIIGSDLCIIASGVYSGDVDIAIPPEQVVLSSEALSSSMRNSMRGRLVSLSETGDKIQAVVDIGVPIVTVITPHSLSGMGITIGDEVYASFKAHGVMVFPREWSNKV